MHSVKIQLDIKLCLLPWFRTKKEQRTGFASGKLETKIWNKTNRKP